MIFFPLWSIIYKAGGSNSMKRTILIVVLLVLAAAGAFGQAISISIGGGALFDWSFNNGVSTSITVPGVDTYELYAGTRNMSFGGFVFVDATYVEVNISFAYGLLTGVLDVPKDLEFIFGKSDTVDAGNMLQLGFSALFKYPLDFGKVTFFPLLGASYNMVLSQKDKDGNDFDSSGLKARKYLSQFGLLGGVGFDFTLSGTLFLRIETLCHVRFPSKFISDAVDAAGDDVYATLGISPQVKIGVGYRF